MTVIAKYFFEVTYKCNCSYFPLIYIHTNAPTPTPFHTYILVDTELQVIIADLHRLIFI